MDHENEYIREVPSYYKQFKKDRTFIINKQALHVLLHNMIETKRDILLSEVSAWLLHYVHIAAWSDGPRRSIAQNKWTTRGTVIGPLEKLRCRLHKVIGCIPATEIT